MEDSRVDILIIGAGPIGLYSAMQLGRAGVTTLVVERRARLSGHPKAGGIHARTMEVWRQWGFADAVRAAGSGNDPVSFAWMTRMNGHELGQIVLGATDAELDVFYSWSPELMCICGQDLYEPILAKAALSHRGVEIRFNVEAIALEQGETDVIVTLRDVSGSESRVSATYVIGADGVRSRTRKWLGITETSEPSFGNSINVRFRAPLEPYRAGRNHGLFWVINPDTQGAFQWRRLGDEWTYNFEAAPGEDPQSYTVERCAQIIRAAVGGPPDLPIEVQSILHWQHDQAVTDEWRRGRVFLAGDAAHRFPPHGGFGMNSGIQDSLNLVWKLVAVLRWGAGAGLLDSYEVERKPVARMNADQCILNTRRMEQTGWLLNDPSVLASIEKPDGQALREKIAAAIPKQREQFFSQGQQFGYIYRSAAMVEDGTEAEVSTVSEYRPSAHPGARAPHLWLTDRSGRRLSTIDLYDGGFVLLTGSQGAAWVRAAEALARERQVPLKAHLIGGEELKVAAGSPNWASLYGVSDSGAVLIRPDGHVGMRHRNASANAGATLAQSLDHILGRALSAQPSYATVAL